MVKATLRRLYCLVVTLALLAAGQIGYAQQPFKPFPAATAREKPAPRVQARKDLMIAQWTRARDWTQQYIAAMPEGNFGFKPVPEVRSFAEQMLHLAFWNFGFTAKSFGQTAPYKEPELTKDELKTKARV